MAAGEVNSASLIYLIGEPGAGKSTLMARLTDGVPSWEGSQPFAHVVYGDPYVPTAIQLGRVRDSFSGTDALSMSVQPLALRWLSNAMPARLVLGEGDRLGTGSFLLDRGLRMRYRVLPVLIEVPPEVAADRRAQRVRDLGGKPQNATWVAGRVSKVTNLVRVLRAMGPVFVVDGSQPPDALVRSVVDQLPDLRRLTEWQAQPMSGSGAS